MVIKTTLNRADGRKEIHRIEILPWHIAGYVEGRCLTHGTDQGPRIDVGDVKRSAVATAQECRRIRQIPFWIDRELSPKGE
jgi:hypothetical protein